MHLLSWECPQAPHPPTTCCLLRRSRHPPTAQWQTSEVHIPTPAPPPQNSRHSSRRTSRRWRSRLRRSRTAGRTSCRKSPASSTPVKVEIHPLPRTPLSIPPTWHPLSRPPPFPTRLVLQQVSAYFCRRQRKSENPTVGGCVCVYCVWVCVYCVL